jgi:hypothetical protein
MKVFLTVMVILACNPVQADVVFGSDAETIWMEGDILASGVNDDEDVENNIIALIKHHGSLYSCEGYVNVYLNRLFVKCFDVKGD